MTSSGKTWLMEEKNSTFLDPQFPYVYIHRLFLNCAEREKSWMQMLIKDKKSRLWPDAAQNAQPLIRAWTFCSSIRLVFPDQVTNILNKLSLIY